MLGVNRNWFRIVGRLERVSGGLTGMALTTLRTSMKTPRGPGEF